MRTAILLGGGCIAATLLFFVGCNQKQDGYSKSDDVSGAYSSAASSIPSKVRETSEARAMPEPYSRSEYAPLGHLADRSKLPACLLIEEAKESITWRKPETSDKGVASDISSSVSASPTPKAERIDAKWNKQENIDAVPTWDRSTAEVLVMRTEGKQVQPMQSSEQVKDRALLRGPELDALPDSIHLPGEFDASRPQAEVLISVRPVEIERPQPAMESIETNPFQDEWVRSKFLQASATTRN